MNRVEERTAVPRKKRPFAGKSERSIRMTGFETLAGQSIGVRPSGPTAASTPVWTSNR